MIFLILVALSHAAHAFPEMVRHGYMNCNSCHVSSNGGGLLNEYGRMISAEALSTWSYENEALFMHGAIKPEKMPKAINIGGDIRALQVHRENKSIREGRYILMQSSLEAAVSLDAISIVASYGKPDQENHIKGGFTRFSINYQARDEVQFRLGRFVPVFGINHPNHTLPSRGFLGFGHTSERNALETHWNGEEWHIAGSVSQARTESRLANNERSASLQVERFFLSSHRVGASLWNGSTEKFDRWILAGHGILGFTKKLYLMTELDFQSKKNKIGQVDRVESWAFFSHLGYELFQGFHLLALSDFLKADNDLNTSFQLSTGVGATWYPRPHFEFSLSLYQKKNLQVSREFEDYATLLMHYYL
ncbi:MAG: hypothetical protein M9962_00635 [Oligoflexia bacterium]|nr:hypothetical protein [Oligoflexia bacterium]